VRGSCGSHDEVQLCFLETCVLPCGHEVSGECALQTAHAVHGGAGGSSEGQRWLWGVQRAAGQLRLLMQWWGSLTHQGSLEHHGSWRQEGSWRQGGSLKHQGSLKRQGSLEHQGFLKQQGTLELQYQWTLPAGVNRAEVPKGIAVLGSWHTSLCICKTMSSMIVQCRSACLDCNTTENQANV